MSDILKKLRGGDLRSIGRAEEVMQDILDTPSLFSEVFEGMLDEDPRVRMRSADAMEKVASRYPEYLQPFKDRMINEVSQIKQQEVRWHVAQMFSYLKVNQVERDQIINILLSYIDTDSSRIVKVFAMQTLADLAREDASIRNMVVEKVEEIAEAGSPAMVSRARKLLRTLNKH